MNGKDNKQASRIKEKGFQVYSKREYIIKDRYLLFLLKEKNDDSPPDDGSSCLIKCR